MNRTQLMNWIFAYMINHYQEVEILVLAEGFTMQAETRDIPTEVYQRIYNKLHLQGI